MAAKSQCIENMFSLIVNNISFVFIFFIHLHTIEAFGESDNYIFEYNHPKNCKNNEYFNLVSFSCIECDENRNLEPSENGKHFWLNFFQLI